MRFGIRASAACLCALLVSVAAHAQTTLIGAVTDDTGAVLPGVSVTAASPVLIEGSRTAVTGPSGLYSITNLRPGVYTVTFSLSGFGIQVRDGVRLVGTSTTTLDVRMAVGTIQESVTVSAASAVVDVQQVQRAETLTREVAEAIPTGNSVWSFVALVPAVRISSPDVGGQRAMQQALMFGRGASSRQTTLEVDGMMVNSLHDDGRAKNYMNPQMNSEMTFVTSGMNAETGHGGLRINLIPRDGGNSFSGSFFGGGTPGRWSADSWNERLGRLGVRGPNQVPGQDSGTPRLTAVWDFNGALGGPIVRDKLWFFTSARDWKTDERTVNAINRDGTPGVDDNHIDSALARLTYQVSSKNKVAGYFDKIWKRRWHVFGANTDRETASENWTPPVNYYTAVSQWTSTISNRMLFELGWSSVGEALRQRSQPSLRFDRPAGVAQCFSTPCYYGGLGDPRQGAFGSAVDPWYANSRRVDNRLGGYTYGGILNETGLYPYNYSVAGSLSYVTGAHNFKAGLVNNWGRFVTETNANGDIQQINFGTGRNPFGHTVPWIGPDHANARCDANGLNCNLIGDPQSVVVVNTPTINRRNVNYDLGIFAQDSWTIDRLTLNYGLRVELAAPSNSAASKPAGRFSQEFLFPELAGLPRYGPDFAPRLSAVYDVFGNARTAAKVGWGRYYHNYGITGVFPLNDYAGGAVRTDTRTWFDVALVPGTNRPDGPAGCESVPVGAPGACNNPFGTNGDNIPQDWEIGIPGNNLFPAGSSIRPADDLQRIFDDVLTAGLQHEVWRGVSINFEYRRRWTKDDRLRSWDTRRFAVDANGKVVNNNIWALEQEVLAPAPYTMVVPIYGIFPEARGIPGQTDMTVSDNVGFVDRYTGAEVGFNARMPGGGVLFGGWNIETPGAGEAAGVRNACGFLILQSDDPNGLRFCNEFAFPKVWRNEYKISGARPLLWDLQIAGSFQIVPNVTSMSEFFRFDRRGSAVNHTRYVGPWYTPANCVAPCVLNGPIITNNVTGQLGTDPTGLTVTMLPASTVKFLPTWRQLDLSIARRFTFGKVRWDARFEAFNVLNQGIELGLQPLGQRGTTLGGQNPTYEQATDVMLGRVLRVSVTSRF